VNVKDITASGLVAKWYAGSQAYADAEDASALIYEFTSNGSVLMPNAIVPLPYTITYTVTGNTISIFYSGSGLSNYLAGTTTFTISGTALTLPSNAASVGLTPGTYYKKA
jgi:hypothetical protein